MICAHTEQPTAKAELSPLLLVQKQKQSKHSPLPRDHRDAQNSKDQPRVSAVQR